MTMEARIGIIGGNGWLGNAIARAAVAAGADGIIVELHPEPERALCDGPQLVPTSRFAAFADEIRALASLMGRTIG